MLEKSHMTEIVIIPSLAVSAEQRTILRNELGGHKYTMKFECGGAVSSLIIGTIILSLGFAAKSFFDAFLKELGKDTYGWMKAKLGLEKAKKVKEVKIQYWIQVGNVSFIDQPSELFVPRHERVLYAVDKIYKQIKDENLMDVRCVELVFDCEKGDYIEARLFSSDIEFGTGSINELPSPKPNTQSSEQNISLASLPTIEARERVMSPPSVPPLKVLRI